MIFIRHLNMRNAVYVCLLNSSLFICDFCYASSTPCPLRPGQPSPLGTSSFVAPHCKEWLMVPACFPDPLGRRVVGIDRPTEDHKPSRPGRKKRNVSVKIQVDVEAKCRFSSGPSPVLSPSPVLWRSICDVLQTAGCSCLYDAELLVDDKFCQRLRYLLSHQLRLLPRDPHWFTVFDGYPEYVPDFYALLGCHRLGDPYRGDIGRCFFYFVTLFHTAAALSDFIDHRQSILLSELFDFFDIALDNPSDSANAFATRYCHLDEFFQAFCRFRPMLFAAVGLSQTTLVVGTSSQVEECGLSMSDAVSYRSFREACSRDISLLVKNNNSFEHAFLCFSEAVGMFRSSLIEIGSGYECWPISLSDFPGDGLPASVVDVLNSDSDSDHGSVVQIMHAISYFSHKGDTSDEFIPVDRPLPLDSLVIP
jgi:hypothetical protein